MDHRIVARASIAACTLWAVMGAAHAQDKSIGFPALALPADPPAAHATTSPVPAATSSIAWSGLTSHAVDQMLAQGINGSGATVCVLADGVSNLSTYLSSGELPPGTQWLTVGTVTGNDFVMRTVPVYAVTNKILVNVTGAMNGLSRVTEIEAWGY